MAPIVPLARAALLARFARGLCLFVLEVARVAIFAGGRLLVVVVFARAAKMANAFARLFLILAGSTANASLCLVLAVFAHRAFYAGGCLVAAVLALSTVGATSPRAIADLSSGTFVAGGCCFAAVFACRTLNAGSCCVVVGEFASSAVTAIIFPRLLLVRAR